jgi:hypothetical protein
MADVPGKFFSAKKVRTGVSPSSPGSEVGSPLPPVNPPGSSLNSVGLTMPSAFTVANSPLTSNGTIGVTGAGTVGQYIRGDGSLADFPESSGGGSSVSYYLNGSVAQGTIGGVAYKELNKVPVLGAGTDFSIAADGYIASFLTDAGDPNLLEIPGGNWNFETYFSASSSGGTPTFYVELYKYNGTTFTLIASSVSAPEFIAFGTTLTPYFSTLAVPTTTLSLTDRLAVRYYVTHSGRTITLHTEDNHLCQIVTTFTTGITALNGLTAQVQNFAVGTTGTDFNIASATATHTFNLPTASAVNRGALSSADWTIFNNKQDALTNPVTGTGSAGQVAFWSSGSAITGEANLFWDSTNDRLGIGTATPVDNFSIIASTSQAGFSVGVANTQVFLRYNNYFSGSQLVSDATKGSAQIGIGRTSEGVITFWTNSSGSGIPIERWRITETGVLQSNGLQTIQTSTGNLTLATGGGNGNIFLSPNGIGKVGIGTTAVGNFDSVPLLVVGGGTADSGIVIYTSNATSGYLQFADGTSGAEEYRGFIKYDHATNSMSFSTNSTTRTDAEWQITSTGVFQSNGAQTIQSSTGNLTIATAAGDGNILLSPNGTGNVGVGTTPSGAKLDVLGNFRVRRDINANQYLDITSGGGFVNILAYNGNSSSIFQELIFQSGNTSSTVERWKINSTGGFQSNGSQTIQTSTGNLILTSADNTGIVDIQRNIRANGAELRLSNASNSSSWVPGDIVGTINFYLPNDTSTTQPIRSQIQAISTSGTTYPSSMNLTFSTANANTLTEGFRLTALSNVHIGTFTTDGGQKLQVTGTSLFTNTATFNSSVTASSFIKSGGTSAQFLKADGSVDSTVYGTGTVTSVAALTLGTTGTDLSSTVATGTTTPVITLNVPNASATARGVVSTGTQTFAGEKTFSSNIDVNGVMVGRGSSGGSAFNGIAGNTGIGNLVLLSITTGYPNTALGNTALRNITTGANNIGIGSAAGNIDSASGAANATSSTSIYIGNDTKPQTNGNTNQIVIGHTAIGLGSNTIVIGNSSTTFGRWFGNLLIGTSTNVASSALTVESTTQGFLPPRMTTTQKNAIASPAAGLVIYDTTLNKLCVRVAAAWQTVTSA